MKKVTLFFENLFEFFWGNTHFGTWFFANRWILNADGENIVFKKIYRIYFSGWNFWESFCFQHTQRPWKSRNFRFYFFNFFYCAVNKNHLFYFSPFVFTCWILLCRFLDFVCFLWTFSWFNGLRCSSDFFYSNFWNIYYIGEIL